jgi:hypothetical protein
MVARVVDSIDLATLIVLYAFPFDAKKAKNSRTLIKELDMGLRLNRIHQLLQATQEDWYADCEEERSPPNKSRTTSFEKPWRW